MSVYVENIGNQKISYKDSSSIKFDDLSEYLLMAKKSISAFANKFYHGLANKMLKDEDAVSNIAYCIMLADWRYDENYTGKRTTKKTRYSYRNQCALWAIQTYVSKNGKKKAQNKILSLDQHQDDSESGNRYKYIVDNKTPNPLSNIINNERTEKHHHIIEKLLNTSGITDRQREYVKLYYIDNYTFEQIGKQFSMTREAIRQSIMKAISVIKSKNQEVDYV